jgi:2-dehydropantoate 2-reductase
MKHAILGPGGVGGLMGACLAKTGASVTMVVRPDALEQYPRQLQFESPFGNFTVPIERTSQVPPVDVLWITVKATQLETALRSIPAADTAGSIVPLLNGIDHVELLRSRYGADRVFPATIAVESERVAPGHFVRRSPFARLSVIARAKSLLGTTLEQLQELKFTCPLIDHEPTLLWGKLAFLAPIALTTTAAGATTGQIAADPHWREQLELCVREACAVATADGAQVDAAIASPPSGACPPECAVPCRRMLSKASHPNWTRLQGPFCVGLRAMDSPFPSRKAWWQPSHKRLGYRGFKD